MGRDKKNGREGGRGGGRGKIVIVSTSTSTQIPNTKQAKKKKTTYANSTVNKI